MESDGTIPIKEMRVDAIWVLFREETCNNNSSKCAIDLKSATQCTEIEIYAVFCEFEFFAGLDSDVKRAGNLCFHFSKSNWFFEFGLVFFWTAHSTPNSPSIVHFWLDGFIIVNSGFFPTDTFLQLLLCEKFRTQTANFTVLFVKPPTYNLSRLFVAPIDAGFFAPNCLFMTPKSLIIYDANKIYTVHLNAEAGFQAIYCTN